ncbi:MAG TPA: heme exporter protein CcmD [Rhizomicrobium sp.]|jgi:heme exporter protein CcmD
MSHFLDTGKYAAYVWPAYGASVLGLGVAAFTVWRAYTNAVKRLAALEREK